VPRAAATLRPAAIGVPLIVVWALHRTGVLAVPHRFASTAAGAGVLALFQATATALDGDARAIALLAEALLLAMLAVRLRYPAALLAAALFGLAGLVLTVGFTIPPRIFASAPRRPVPLGPVVTAGLTGLLLAVTAIVLCWVAIRLARLTNRGWMWAGIVALYGASGAMLSIGLAVSPD